ncbi:hypothetical protein ACJIZ3_020728 [Penstemon smallii]|uniref:RING-type domain-containing protein n=1 Tax=Penstemon smallii TaxID=265156 RepID=A0ABD3SJJ6_9LAMI
MPTSVQYPTRNQRKLLLFFLKCIIMVIIISLFLFFIGFAAIVLLHFIFLSHTFNRRLDNSSSASATAEPQPQLLPDVVYIAAKFPTKSECAICLDCFEEGDDCRNLPVCKHLFHAGCLDRWIGKKPTCPVCRTRVDLDPKGLTGSRIGGGDDDRWKRLWAVDFEQGTSSLGI